MTMFKALVAGAVALAVTGCQFLTPGNYDAAMTIRKNGSFTYRYTGEIQFLTQSGIMQQMAAKDAAEREAEVFNPDEQSCWNDEGEERACTKDEVAEKQKEWETNKAAKVEEDKKTFEMMKSLFGGMDPSDPATMHEFARRLQLHKGWKKVAYKNAGLFEVEYEITGQIDRDFTFPVFEGVNLLVPFVQAARRVDGKVRVTAPAFIQSKEGDITNAAMGMAMKEMFSGNTPFKQPNGTFTLSTDAQILTNNTDEGPVGQGAMKTLTWKTGTFQKGIPEALIGL